jgi:hypothetical protein
MLHFICLIYVVGYSCFFFAIRKYFIASKLHFAFQMAHICSWYEFQSFSDLWIDFLLKESQERERRENAEGQAKAGISRQDRELTSADSRGVTASETLTSTVRGDASLKYPIGPQETVHSTDRFSNFPVTYSFVEQNQRTHTSRGRGANPVDTEFSTVPLTSASNNQHSRIMPRP